LEPLTADDPVECGGYRILGKLGSGGQGVAYLAQSGPTWCVVKRVPRGFSDRELRRAWMAREVDSLKAIDSPLVAGLLEADLQAEEPWFAMEYVPGVSLAALVDESGPLSSDALMELALGLAKCLDATERAGVTHRDLKPSNVMMSPTGPRLIDFGVATHAEATNLTSPGELVGTMRWLAPEQLMSSAVTPATDVHAWGMLVHFAASGGPAVSAETVPGTMYQILHVSPDLPDGLPAVLAGLVEQALRKAPEQRPSVAEILLALGDANGAVLGHAAVGGQSGSDPLGVTSIGAEAPEAVGTSVAAGATAKSARGGNGRLVAAMSALVVLVMAGLVAWWGLGRGSESPQAGSASAYATEPVAVDLSALEAWSEVERIAVGDTSSCLLTARGSVFCWGSNSDGQLGSEGEDSPAPRSVDNSGAIKGRKLTRLSVGGSHACALDDQGLAYCWGSNSQGQVGITGDVRQSSVPAAVSRSGDLAGVHLVLIGASGDTTCALDDAGQLYCWGENSNGQFGNGTFQGSRTPQKVSWTGALAGRSLKRIAVGSDHSCGTDAAGNAYCWGANAHGQLGDGTTRDSPVPVAVANVDGFRQERYDSTSVAGAATCGWTRPGKLACWGQGDQGQIGNGGVSDSATPQIVDFQSNPSASPILRMATAGSFACAISQNGRELSCWGANSSGQLGNGSTSDSTTPTRVRPIALPDSAGFARISVGPETACALAVPRQLWCWGSDYHGMLGTGGGESDS
jgi:alpha-tubulin suppressor-like RCC1 family protein/predicted Ser/Thr protein kinase